jgi:hypothetical protein
MGNALSIAAVSRVLRQIVEGNVTRYGLDGHIGADVVVTAEPPREDPNRVRLNLFLYRAVESPARRNDPLPTHDQHGNRTGRPTLTLDLHYAVTAYAEGDFQSEMMLGCAMQALNETPVLNRSLILEVLSQDQGANTLLESRLAELIENIRLRHRNLTEEAFTRLWSAFHVPYRLTAFYEASVVLIEGDLSARAAPPVLHRPRPSAHGRLGPVTSTLTHASNEMFNTGDEVTLHGLMLDGNDVRVEAFHQDPSIEIAPIDVPPADATDTEVTFAIPPAWPIGRYEIRVSLVDGGGRRHTNRLALSLAPTVTVSNIERDPNPPNLVTIELQIVPDLRPAQQTLLVVGTASASGPSISAATNTLTFSGLDLPAGPAPLRLQVDGIESPWIDRGASPPTILPAAIVNIP